MSRPVKVVFIARRFPPSIGGMQQFAFDLSEALPRQNIELEKITWGGSSRLVLPVVLPWLFLQGLWALMTDRSIQIIHMQDAVLSPLGWLLSKLSGKPWVVVAHGLDLTFKLQFYQKVNLYFARRATAMIAISEATAAEAIKRGIAADKVTVIPLGVAEASLTRVDRKALVKDLGIPETDHVLLTVGRLAKRKGVTWFINKVLPKLPDDVHYVVIGEGNERNAIEKAIANQNLNDRVHLLGAVDDKTKHNWLATADIFVMPNIRVKGDMEGFGIVAHEAALAERPVVASNLEGIAQALQDKQNGLLLPAGDAGAYQKTIKALLDNKAKRQDLGKRARAYTLKTFGWSAIAGQYKKVYEKLIS